MEATDIITLLSRHGVKPTANRLLVARELDRERRPLSLMELERGILTMDKSSVYRVLTLFREHGLVHVVEGNEGVVSYELCRAGHASEDDDLHPISIASGATSSPAWRAWPSPTSPCPGAIGGGP